MPMSFKADLHNFRLKLSQAAYSLIELYFINQAQNSPQQEV
jgi:hypothetical protein